MEMSLDNWRKSVGEWKRLSFEDRLKTLEYVTRMFLALTTTKEPVASSQAFIRDASQFLYFLRCCLDVNTDISGLKAMAQRFNDAHGVDKVLILEMSLTTRASAEEYLHSSGKLIKQTLINRQWMHETRERHEAFLDGIYPGDMS